MRFTVLDDQPALSHYYLEMLRIWGVPNHALIAPRDLASLGAGDALIVPAGALAATHEAAILDAAKRGACVAVMRASGELARTAKLTVLGERETPLRLRVVDEPAPGLAGEMLPIVGKLTHYAAEKGVTPFGFIVDPNRWEGESPGIVVSSIGTGKLIAFAFDLAHVVLTCRQGDPANAERMPHNDPATRASQLAANLGQRDYVWIPAGDLLSRLLVDLLRFHVGVPVPYVWHLPGDNTALVLYSGDEDGAKADWNQAEFDTLEKFDGRMSLYIIPRQTTTTREMANVYRKTQDLGPHPDLRPLDGRPMHERLASYRDQIIFFREKYGFVPRTVRNHCLTWAGFTEMAEVQAEVGIKMDANFLGGGNYLRFRDASPYSAYPAAMPMRFCRLDGKLVDVYQQHMQIEDDVHFGDHIEYSARLTPARFSTVLDRMLHDQQTRFHMPMGFNIHPSNYVKFSGEHGDEILVQAKARGVPVWSYDQWLDFWEARERCVCTKLEANASSVSIWINGTAGGHDVRLAVPAKSSAGKIREVRVNGTPIAASLVKRYGEEITLVVLPAGDATVEASYG